MKKIIIFSIFMALFLIEILPQSRANEGLISQMVHRKIHDKPAFKPYGVTLDGLTKNKPAPVVSVSDSKLKQCYDERFDVQFLCRPEWKNVAQSNGFKLIVTENESVSMSVVKIQKPFLSLYQLTRKKLQSLGNYASGFAQNEVTLSGHTAFKVNAFSDAEPQSRLTDYYILRKRVLFRISFAVYPKERWEEEKFFIKDLIKGFKL